MSNNVNIYVGYEITENGTPVLRYPLEPLLKSIRDVWEKNSETVDLFKCPAFTEHFKNYYVVRCPYDLELFYDKTGRPRLKLPSPQFEMDHNLHTVNRKSGKISTDIIQLFSGAGTLYFFAEESCQVTVHTPFYHNNTKLVGASFDIGKWFRPIHPAILNFKKEKMSFKRGDALMYISFPSEIKVNFIRTEIDHPILTLSNATTGIKWALNYTPLAKVYEHFTRSGLRKKLLKKLEENRID